MQGGWREVLIPSCSSTLLEHESSRANIKFTMDVSTPNLNSCGCKLRLEGYYLANALIPLAPSTSSRDQFVRHKNGSFHLFICFPGSSGSSAPRHRDWYDPYLDYDVGYHPMIPTRHCGGREAKYASDRSLDLHDLWVAA